MADTEDHPHDCFEWGCPICGSPDVARVHRTNPTRATRPRFECRECYEKFWDTVEVRIDNE